MKRIAEKACLQYPESLKESAIQRYLTSELSFRELGEELGIRAGTIKGWVTRARHRGTTMAKQQEKCSTDEREASEKLRLILEAHRLDDAELGEFLRREGIKEGDLERWQEDALSGLQAAPSRAVDEYRIRELERETTRQKKRLREAEALLELQKKVQALWEDEGDDTSRS
jgi:transposase-like protein